MANNYFIYFCILLKIASVLSCPAQDYNNFVALETIAATNQAAKHQLNSAEYRAAAGSSNSSLGKLVDNGAAITADDINAILAEIQFQDINRTSYNPNTLGFLAKDVDYIFDGDLQTGIVPLTGVARRGKVEFHGDAAKSLYRVGFGSSSSDGRMPSTSRFGRPSPSTMEVGKASAAVELATVRMCRSATGSSNNNSPVGAASSSSSSSSATSRNPQQIFRDILQKLRQIDLAKIHNKDLQEAWKTFTRFNKQQRIGVDTTAQQNGLPHTIRPLDHKQQQLRPTHKDFDLERRSLNDGQFVDFRQHRPPPNRRPNLDASCPALETQYRTADGSNNNLQEPEWGRQGTTLKRLHNIGPHYDGVCNIKEPRMRAYAFDSNYRNIFADKPQFGNKRLPNARVVTDIAMDAGGKTGGAMDAQITQMVAQYGQFIDHDLTMTPLYGALDGMSDLPLSQSCVQDGRCLNHPECICICNTGDAGDKACLDLRRSAPGQTSLGDYRQQVNDLTAFMDGSNIYGSSAVETNELRARAPVDAGLLKVSTNDAGREMLPRESDVAAPGRTDGCRPQSTTCYAAGDTRVNEHVGLASMHTLWVREHNRVARHLRALNPHWAGEKTFQETRRVTGALLQHITYRNWLPVVVGDSVMRAFGIQVESDTSRYQCQSYNAKMEPGTLNEFATSAFRFGHTLVDNFMTRQNMGDRVRIADTFFDMTSLQNDSRTCDALLGGLSRDASQKFDNQVASVVRNELFRSATFTGHDLPARNIQRGRDHGQPGYAFYAWACQQRYGPNDLGSILYPNLRGQSFDPLSEAFKIANIKLEDLPLRGPAQKLLQRAYQGLSAADVDLFAAGISETAVSELVNDGSSGSGGILGPTFACIIAEQFRQLKFGDRFFYTNPTVDTNGRASPQCRGANAFSPCQLRALSRMSMAHVMCANGVGSEVQRDAFRKTSPKNPMVKCSALETLDLSSWREGFVCNESANCQ